jgi:hypothetical protein
MLGTIAIKPKIILNKKKHIPIPKGSINLSKSIKRKG